MLSFFTMVLNCSLVFSRGGAASRPIVGSDGSICISEPTGVRVSSSVVVCESRATSILWILIETLLFAYIILLL